MCRGWLVAALAAGLGSCAGADPDVARREQALIVDAVHNGGQAGFYFLPPLVPAPAIEGTFDPTRSPQVTIDELTDDLGFRRTVLANAAMTQVSNEYRFSWRTRDFGVSSSFTYRVSISDGAQQLGFGDVKVFPNQ